MTPEHEKRLKEMEEQWLNADAGVIPAYGPRDQQGDIPWLIERLREADKKRPEACGGPRPRSVTRISPTIWQG